MRDLSKEQKKVFNYSHFFWFVFSQVTLLYKEKIKIQSDLQENLYTVSTKFIIYGVGVAGLPSY